MKTAFLLALAQFAAAATEASDIPNGWVDFGSYNATDSMGMGGDHGGMAGGSMGMVSLLKL